MALRCYTHVIAHRSVEDSFTPMRYKAVWMTDKPLAALVEKGEPFEYMQARVGVVRKGKYPVDQPHGYPLEVGSELADFEKETLFLSIEEGIERLKKEVKEKEAEVQEFMFPVAKSKKAK